MLGGSSAVLSAWREGELLALAEPHDGVFRAVLWDVVVPRQARVRGLGRSIRRGVAHAPAIKRAERI